MFFLRLNAREVKRGMGVNVEETISDVNDSQGGLPSLHFRLPANAKAVSCMPPAVYVILTYSYDMTQTRQTLNFTQQETESARSEAEEVSKQLGDEEHLVRVTSGQDSVLAF